MLATPDLFDFRDESQPGRTDLSEVSRPGLMDLDPVDKNDSVNGTDRTDALVLRLERLGWKCGIVPRLTLERRVCEWSTLPMLALERLSGEVDSDAAASMP